MRKNGNRCGPVLLDRYGGPSAIVTKHTNSVSDQNSVYPVEQNKFAFFINCVSKPILYQALSTQLLPTHN